MGTKGRRNRRERKRIADIVRGLDSTPRYASVCEAVSDLLGVSDVHAAELIEFWFGMWDFLAVQSKWYIPDGRRAGIRWCRVSRKYFRDGSELATAARVGDVADRERLLQYSRCDLTDEQRRMVATYVSLKS